MIHNIIAADCADGDIKLLGGGSKKDGALQVCLDQRWGTVSGDGWTAVDTKVACRQLGFNSTGVCKFLLFDCITCDRMNNASLYLDHTVLLINPRRACEARVTVLYLVCKSVCRSVCLSLRTS